MDNRKKLCLVAALVVVVAVTAVVRLYLRAERESLLSGTVEATKADVIAKCGGTIVSLRVKEGDRVKAGETAAILERHDLAASLLRDKHSLEKAQAELQKVLNGARDEEKRAATARREQAAATLAKASLDYERSARLVQEGAIAKADFDAAQSNYRAAQENFNALREAELTLLNGSRQEDVAAARQEVARLEQAVKVQESLNEDLILKIPVNGIVLTKNFEQGEYVTAGQRVVTVIDLNDCWVRVYVSSAELPQIKIGQPASVFVAGFKEPFKAHVKEIREEAEYTPRQSITHEERATLVFAVKVAVENPGGVMKPGLPADVKF